MERSLYQTLTDIEEKSNMDSNTINKSEMQESIMKNYEKNLIFNNAIQGIQSIEKCLEEISRINKGIKKFCQEEKTKSTMRKFLN